MTTYVIFDAASGEIVGIDRAARSLEDARRAAATGPVGSAGRCAELEVIEAPDEHFAAGCLWRVDVRRRRLVEADGPEGVGAGFGSASGAPASAAD